MDLGNTNCISITRLNKGGIMSRRTKTNWLLFLAVVLTTTGLLAFNHSQRVTDSFRNNTFDTIELDFSASPNPFDAQTFISINSAEPFTVNLVVKDRYGEVVRDLFGGELKVGHNIFPWDGTDDNGIRLAPDKYTCELTMGRFTSRTIILILK